MPAALVNIITILSPLFIGFAKYNVDSIEESGNILNCAPTTA